MVDILGTVFHYAVFVPEDDHARCFAQRNRVIAMHEGMGYRDGGAYNGHFCQHGGTWISYRGPNQATGNTWANLNLEAWCYLATVGTPVTDPAAQAAFDLTLLNPRDRIHPHSDFYATACCGDPLREWIAAGALPPSPLPTTQQPPPIVEDDMRIMRNDDIDQWWFFPPVGGAPHPISHQEAWDYAVLGLPHGKGPGQRITNLIHEHKQATAALKG